MNNVTLIWNDPVNVKSIKYTREDVDMYIRGIYIWGFRIQNSFIPYYIGITNDILYRIFEHVSSICAGKYCIQNKQLLNKFFEFKKDLESTNECLLYIPDWPYGFSEFISKYRIFQEHILYMVEQMEFSYATIDSKIDLKPIETNCIIQAGKEKLWNTRAGALNTEYSITHKGNEEISRLFEINKENG